MEFINLLTDNLGALAFAILGLGAILGFVYAGWQYNTAFGDQQQMARARNAFFGSCVGLLIGGFAFVIPEVLSREVIEPSGGAAIAPSGSAECDNILRSRLALETNVNTPERMNQLVRFIQADNPEGCGQDLWSPVIGQDVFGSLGTTFAADYRKNCFGGGSGEVLQSIARPPLVEGVVVPAGLMYSESHSSSSYHNRPRPVSSRDSVNNVIVYFGQLLDRRDRPKDGVMDRADDKVSESVGYPTDGSKCWMFIARENLWLRN